MTYNGVDYAYIYNVQGDVIALVDSTGAKVVEYYYDAWGKILSKTGTLATSLGTLNPFSYRGYVYDEETGLYYLCNRYYLPRWNRFLNTDMRLARMGGILQSNAMAYASNSPIMRVDMLGCADYIYTSKDNYYTENDWGMLEWLHVNTYYVEIGGTRYRANSKETVEFTNWNAIDFEFTTTTLNKLITVADQTPYTINRVLKESVGGELDFKLQLDRSKLYYDSSNKVVYNRNEAGNYVWAYYLTYMTTGIYREYLHRVVRLYKAVWMSRGTTTHVGQVLRRHSKGWD